MRTEGPVYGFQQPQVAERQTPTAVLLLDGAPIDGIPVGDPTGDVEGQLLLIHGSSGRPEGALSRR